MRNVRLSALLFSLFLMNGCATFTAPVTALVAFYQPHEYRTPNYGAMTYLDILNAEAKAKWYKKPRNRTHLVIYGKVSTTDKKLGIRLTIPF